MAFELKEGLKIEDKDLPFKLNHEYSGLLNELIEQELKALEADIIKHGCDDALIIWKEENTLLDGYHRLYFCLKNNVPYKTQERSFKYPLDAKRWILEHNLARRSQGDSPYYECEVAILQFEGYFKRKAKERKRQAGTMKGKSEEEVLQALGKPIHVNKELGKIAGYSAETIRKARFIMHFGTEKQKTELRKRYSTTNLSNVYDKVLGWTRTKKTIKKINLDIRRREEDDDNLAYHESVILREMEEDVKRKTGIVDWAEDHSKYSGLISGVVGGMEYLVDRLQKIIIGKGYFDTEYLWGVFEKYRFAESLMELSEQMQVNYNQIIEIMEEGEEDKELLETIRKIRQKHHEMDMNLIERIKKDNEKILKEMREAVEAEILGEEEEEEGLEVEYHMPEPKKELSEEEIEKRKKESAPLRAKIDEIHAKAKARQQEKKKAK